MTAEERTGEAADDRKLERRALIWIFLVFVLFWGGVSNLTGQIE